MRANIAIDLLPEFLQWYLNIFKIYYCPIKQLLFDCQYPIYLDTFLGPTHEISATITSWLT